MREIEKSCGSKVKKHTRQFPAALALEAIKENTIRSEKYRDIYDFYRTLNVQKHPPADMKNDKLLCRRLREPLKVGERMLALTERLKRKDAPKHLHK